jgi:hypothetical protein
MSETSAQGELKTRFNTIWANRIPVSWPNLAFTPPSPQSPWCRFSIVGGESKQTTIGATNNNHRSTGIVYVSIFIPSNTGDLIALQRADEAAAIFRNWAGTNVRCRVPQIKAIGDSDGWYQINVMTAFLRDELI